MTVLANPRRPSQNRALLDDCSGADENCVADKWLADQFAEHRRLQTELEITRDLPERVPNIFLRLEKFRMRGVFEAEKFRGRKHVLDSTAPRDLLSVFRVASFPTAGGDFVAQFITFSPILCKPRLHAGFPHRRDLCRQRTFFP